MGTHHHDHDHPHHRHTLIWALAITLGFAFVEAVSGMISNSLALLGDAGHMFTDASALGLAAFAAWLAKRPPSHRHSYGLVRVEIVAALINSLALIIIVIGITVAAIARLREPQPVSGGTVMVVAFIGLLVGFAIKIPSFPFHTWLPDAHVEAPTPISVILAGVLLKLGSYGIMRICMPVFPDAMIHFAWWIALFGVISMVYGALVAMAQTDFKKLIAYSSISHMGVVTLGMASMNTQGMTGAVFQMFNHLRCDNCIKRLRGEMPV